MAALIGINAIRPHVGNLSDATILKLKREHPDFPIRKLRGQWVSEVETITKWFRAFSEGKITSGQTPDPEKKVKKAPKRKAKRVKK